MVFGVLIWLQAVLGPAALPCRIAQASVAITEF
jgi:hypothetical protein